MPPAPTDRPKANDLQFDHVVPAGGLTCVACKRPIDREYYHVGGKNICAACKAQVEAELARNAVKRRSGGAMVRAAIFGLGAAVAGAILYYGVIALTGLEIGIVAIVIGYMVGYSVRKGAAVGGRRFQILALVLTYFAVGLAYTPMVIKAAMEGDREKVVARSDSGAVGSAAVDSATVDSTTALAGKASGRPSSALPGLLALAGLIFALPVMYVFSTMPSGAISALIIGFGLLQAWRLTGSPSISFAGPYKPPVAPTTASG